MFPGVRLNFSASGISTTIGSRGASVTFGQTSTTVNLGIPGTGLSYHQRVSEPRVRVPPVRGPLPAAPAAELPDNIASASVEAVASEQLQGVETLIREVVAERATLERELPGARREVAKAERRLGWARNWFLGFFLGSSIPAREAALETVRERLAALEARYDGAFIDADFGLEQAARDSFSRVAVAFEELSRSTRIWDITGEYSVDRQKTRSAAASTLRRVPVRFATNDDPIIQTELQILSLQNANGADLFVYPGFLLLRNAQQFALVDLRDVRLGYEGIRFHEEDGVPPDAKVLGTTWAKTNKDGSRDRRFADNRAILTVGYGKITIQTTQGLNEAYMFSNASSASRFAEVFVEYQNHIRAQSGQAAFPPETPSAPEAPAPMPPVALRSVSKLRNAHAASPQHALRLLSEFVEELEVEIAAFSEASHSIKAFEQLARELGSVPDLVHALVGRTQRGSIIPLHLLSSIREMMAGTLAQIHQGIVAARPEHELEPENHAALQVIREVERQVRRSMSAS